MKKNEIVYREILNQVLQKKYFFTQLSLSKKLFLSLSTINYALRPLRQMGAVKVLRRSFQVVEPDKILYYWASLRNLERDLIYSTRVDAPIRKIESEMPPGIIFTAYSAYKLKYDDVPADYSEVYVYGELKEIKKRFPPLPGPANVFLLSKDSLLENYGKTVPLPQLFVDLWNLKEWYAKEFIEAVKKKLSFNL